jgi:hypothetical protein
MQRPSDKKNPIRKSGFQTISLERQTDGRLEAYSPEGNHLPGIGMWFRHKYGDLPLQKEGNQITQVKKASIRIHGNPWALSQKNTLPQHEIINIPCPPSGAELQWHIDGPGRHVRWHEHATAATSVPAHIQIEHSDILALCWNRNYDLLLHLTKEASHLRYPGFEKESNKPTMIPNWTMDHLWKTDGRVPLLYSLHADISQGPNEFKNFLRIKFGDIETHTSRNLGTDLTESVFSVSPVIPTLEDFLKKTPAAWRDLIQMRSLNIFVETDTALKAIAVQALQTEKPTLEKAIKLANIFEILALRKTPEERKKNRMEIRQEAKKGGIWEIWQDRIFAAIFTKKEVFSQFDANTKIELALWVIENNPEFFIRHQDRIQETQGYIGGLIGAGRQIPPAIVEELWHQIQPINVVRWLIPGIPVSYKANPPHYRESADVQNLCAAVIQYCKEKNSFSYQDAVETSILQLLERHIIDPARIQDVHTAVKHMDRGTADKIREKLMAQLV